jgi:16S rRNA C967 or C1407 C5-methylase (RsmB/RsmF family)
VAGAWQLPYDRAMLSARESTVTREIHKWLGGACAVGAAQRQELVSMVPVALLDVQPHHLCLDCCASPGSKTTQLLELVSGAGAVVANDMKPVRAFTLSKRCRALGLASSRLAVVTHRAQALPSLIGAGCGDGAARRGYDRIVCDVPCTGDGAIRKAPELWRYWSPHLGRQLHSLQLQLALRDCAPLPASHSHMPLRDWLPVLGVPLHVAKRCWLPAPAHTAALQAPQAP